MKGKRIRITEYSASSQGFTLVEMIVAMAVLSVLAAASFTLFFAGGQTYKAIYTDYQQQHEARIAMSYLNVKIRQNDYILTDGNHAVKVLTDIVSGNKYLRVFVGPNASDFDYIYADTSGSLWVTQDEAKARDYNTGETLIADGLDSIYISSPEIEPGVYDYSIINIEINYDGGKELTETIKLRSDIS